MSLPRVVMTCAPFRLSFAGGGTDVPTFYSEEGGAVLSTTIDKFVYVTAKRHGDLFGEAYRLNYFDSEHVDNLDDIRNDIMRECLRLVPVEPPLYISTVADLPSSSGLGSSSAFAVGLLHALHVLRGDRVSIAQLAEEACYIEMDRLAHPIGKQDQYAAAIGGFNHFNFHVDGRVTIEPQHLSAECVGEIFGHLMLFWTGISRSSIQILTDQSTAIREKRENLRAMRGHCEELRNLLHGGKEFDSKRFGTILNATWRAKKDIAASISNAQIDNWYQIALDAGATGGKILGAGGGGFLLFIVPKNRQAAVAHALSCLRQVHVNYEATGTRLLIPHGH